MLAASGQPGDAYTRHFTVEITGWEKGEETDTVTAQAESASMKSLSGTASATVSNTVAEVIVDDDEGLGLPDCPVLEDDDETPMIN